MHRITPDARERPKGDPDAGADDGRDGPLDLLPALHRRARPGTSTRATSRPGCALEHPTLDGLTAQQFTDAMYAALGAAMDAGPDRERGARRLVRPVDQEGDHAMTTKTRPRDAPLHRLDPLRHRGPRGARERVPGPAQREGRARADVPRPLARSTRTRSARRRSRARRRSPPRRSRRRSTAPGARWQSRRAPAPRRARRAKAAAEPGAEVPVG